MKYRLIVGLCASTMLAQAAHAAWFCGSEPSEFASQRAYRHVAPKEVHPGEITAGPPVSSVTMCDDKGCSLFMRESTPEKQEDWSARVDAFETRVTDLDNWAASLEDGCLRDAYKHVIGGYRDIIAKDRRAIDFMKSPEPLAPGS